MRREEELFGSKRILKITDWKVLALQFRSLEAFLGFPQL